MIKIKNKHLKDAADFLVNGITAKGKKNIDRMRVAKAIESRLAELVEEETTLLKEYAKTDEKGDFFFVDGGIKMKDMKGYEKQSESLREETFTLEGVNLEMPLKTVKKLVNNHDKELIGAHAEMHFMFIEAFEESASAAEKIQEEKDKEDEE